MISVIVYGRNDTHGYNLHRRAALSLNCLAEVLDAPGDEIIFVDYNTPDELPTFVEALADTLTDRCLGLLRVLRVPACAARGALRRAAPTCRRRARRSERRGASRQSIEPVAALDEHRHDLRCRSSEQSLSELCDDLPDGFYGLPRFELPEWLWERLPRTRPPAGDGRVARLGPAPAPRRADA